ncbi:G-D-S-L family lipolytic protein [Calothrix parasitica NIES-267]|uniref:G-D-S-L family lipolytic protein n=1 Tax=Calothrix parasitica NIES-267 TaxID=1973488 RepID=A0A1Z4LY62_9CYAN|nr:G-D-S-L family lipolytic protein [Calothrix parasitica NIES-267]
MLISSLIFSQSTIFLFARSMNQDTIKIVTLGDSITQAENGQNSYRKELWEQLNIAGYNVDFVGSENRNKDGNNFENRNFDPDHEGHWGWRIDEIINGRGREGNLSDWLTGYTPDVALIHLGSNDAIQNNSAISSVEELNQVIDILRQDNSNITIFLSQLIPTRDSGINSRIDDLNDRIPGIIADKNQANSPIILVDQSAGFNANTDTYDGVHPNDAGEAKMAQKWFDALKNYFDDVDINPPDNTVEAINDSSNINEDTQVSIDVLANDGDGDNLTINSVGSGSNGTTAIVNNEIVYTPDSNFNGTDSFSYEVSNGNGGTDTATVTVNVAPVNDTPVAQNDSATTNQETVVSIKVLENDSDVDGDSLTIISADPGSNGNTAIVNNEIVYTPDSNFNGTDSFSYEISDGNGGTNTAQVSVTVTESDSGSGSNPSARVNAGLLALYNFNEGSGDRVFDVSGVGTALNLEINNPNTTTWGNGILNLNSPSLIASVQAADKLIDGITATQEVTMEAWLTPGNRSQNGPARIATLSSNVSNRNFTFGQAGDDYNVRFRTTTTGNNGVGRTVSSTGGLLETQLTHVVYTREADGDASLYVNNQLVSSETIGGNLSNWNENYRFALGNEFGGGRSWLGSLDLFAVYNQAFDASEVAQNFFAGSDESGSPSTPPTTGGNTAVAANDSININEDTQVNIDVLENDEDGDNLTINSVGSGSNGTTAIVNNQILYTPDSNFNGTDSFSYEVSNGNGGTDTATVTVNVAPVNDLPVAQNDTATTNQETGISINVLANDSDVDGDNLTIASVNPGSNGTTVIVNNQIVYTPEANFTGEDSFTYSIEDSNGVSDTAQVTVTVNESGSNSSDKVTEGLLALYNFDEGSGDTVFDVSGVGTALNLEIDDLTGVNWGDGVLNINSPSLIASVETADKLIDGITATQEITLEAWVTPGNRSQNGPARIATLSSNVANRNFTLGQAGDDYNVRLRTTSTGNNGVRTTVSSEGGLLDTELTHVIYTRSSDGNASLYIDSQLVSTETIGGDFSNWDDNYRLGLGDEFGGGRSWLGSLDQFAVYNQAFDASEVAQNYLAGS